MITAIGVQPKPRPILLFNDECSVCRHIASWVEKLAHDQAGEPTVMDIPIGEDQTALELISPGLNIWDAYAVIHLVMPDGTLKTGGEAVAEVFRNMPTTRWFTGLFAWSVCGARPFQSLLNIAYVILSDIRPVFGCESCGIPKAWTRPLHFVIKWIRGLR